MRFEHEHWEKRTSKEDQRPKSEVTRKLRWHHHRAQMRLGGLGGLGGSRREWPTPTVVDVALAGDERTDCVMSVLTPQWVE